MGPNRTIKDHRGPHGTILWHTGPYMTIQDFTQSGKGLVGLFLEEASQQRRIAGLRRKTAW